MANPNVNGLCKIGFTKQTSQHDMEYYTKRMTFLLKIIEKGRLKKSLVLLWSQLEMFNCNIAL